MNEQRTVTCSDARKAVMELLRSRSKKARFMTEISASLLRANIDAQEIERVLAELEAEGVVMIRNHFCADPHLAGIDLRIVGLVEGVDGADAQMSAIREIDNAWDR